MDENDPHNRMVDDLRSSLPRDFPSKANPTSKKDANNDDELERRLYALRTAVQKASEEALQRTNPAVLLEDERNPNASFHLGMELFGAAEPAQMERAVQEHLIQLEQQLQTILRSMRDDQEEKVPVRQAPLEEQIKSSAQLDASVLRFKLFFLKQCSQIRQLVDESIACSDPSYASSSSTVSPEDLVTHSNSNANTGVVDMVQAMRKLLQAEKAWKDVHQELAQFVENREAVAPKGELQDCQNMMEWLRQDIRNPKVDLISQVQTLWNNCVTIEAEALIVRGYQTRSTNSSSSMGEPPLAQVHGVMQVLAQENNHSLQKEVLLPFATKLYHQVIQPMLDLHRKPRQVPVRWKFHELQERGVSSTLSSSVVMTSSTTTKLSLGPVKTLEWEREEQEEDTADLKEDTVEAWKETLAFVQRILVFVAETAFLGRSELCQLWGNRLLGSPKALGAIANSKNELDLSASAFQLLDKDDGVLMEPLVDLMMDTCLPDFVTPPKTAEGEGLVEQLRSIQSRLEQVIQPFLETMESHGLLEVEQLSSPTVISQMTRGSNETQERCRLREFVQNFLSQYIHHRSSLLLDQARSLILHEKDYHNTQSVGVDPASTTSEEDRRLGLDPGLDVFLLHQSCVSDTALALHQLCVACMDESVACAVALANKNETDNDLDDLPASLYQVARQVLDLYRVIVPVRYGKEVAQVPRTAAIFYNDCVYFAHHCHSLGLEYREKFPESASFTADLHRICIFVDKVPLFREMADRCMRDMLDRQSHQIQELVRPRIPLLSKALQSAEIVAEWADAETGLNAALYHIQHLSQQWKPILSKQTFHSTVGYLAHVTFSLLLEPVLSATSFSQDACEFVHDLFGKALDRVQSLLELSIQHNEDELKTVVPTWHRFKAVGMFMDMTLNDVEAALSRGVFAHVTGHELSHLLTAVFDESRRQQELLKLVKRHQ